MSPSQPPHYTTLLNQLVYAGQHLIISENVQPTAAADGMAVDDEAKAAAPTKRKKHYKIPHTSPTYGIHLLPHIYHPTTLHASQHLNVQQLDGDDSKSAALPVVTVVTQCGILHHNAATNALSVHHPSLQHYEPTLNDLVVVTVVSRHAEHYLCDLGQSIACGHRGYLPATAFNGASKRNKPNLQVGATVYCRVARIYSADTADIELTCIDPTITEDWMTGNSLLGPLSAGTVIDTTTAGSGNGFTMSYCRDFLIDDEQSAYLLELVGSRMPFELAVGVNGRVWIHAGSPQNTIIVANLMIKTAGMTRQQQRTEIKKFFNRSNAE